MVLHCKNCNRLVDKMIEVKDGEKIEKKCPNCGVVLEYTIKARPINTIIKGHFTKFEKSAIIE